MMKNPVLPAFIVGALLGAACGYVLKGSGAGSPLGSLPANEREEAYQEGYKKAQKDINDIFVAKGMSYPLDYEIKEVYGYVKSVNGTSFVIEYDASQFTVFDKGMKTVTVDANAAVINKIVDAPEREVTEEELGQVAPGGGDVIIPEGTPPPTESQTIAQMFVKVAVGDIKVGDYVKVTADGAVRAGDAISAKDVIIYNMSHSQPGEGVPPPFTREFNGTGPLPGTEPSPVPPTAAPTAPTP